MGAGEGGCGVALDEEEVGGAFEGVGKGGGGEGGVGGLGEEEWG